MNFYEISVNLVLAGLLIGGAVADEWIAHHDMTGATYQSRFDQYLQQGYQLTWINGFSNGTEVRFAAIWEKLVVSNWTARHGMTSGEFQQQFNWNLSRGYKLVQVCGYTVNGVDLYAAIWNQDNSNYGWQARHGLTSAQFQTTSDSLLKQGYRLSSVSGYSYAGTSTYAAIWTKQPGPNWVTYHDMTSDQYQQRFHELATNGYIPKMTIGFNTAANRVLFVAFWEKPNEPTDYQANYNMNSSEYQRLFNNFTSEGFKLVSISGYVLDGNFAYAAIWKKPATADYNHTSNASTTIEPSEAGSSDIPISTGTCLLSSCDQVKVDNLVVSFMKKWQIPGVSMALGRDEMLIYENGFGYADKDAKEAVTTAHRFRIASCSKPITSAAIMKLVENEQLSLDDFVFGPDGLLGSPATLLDANVLKVRVRHLLQHTSGGWQNDWRDPVFQQLQLSNQDILNYVLRTYRLEYPPGTHYAYSNFGFFLLARIIENLTAQTYESYVVKNILQPSGINDAFIGGSTLAGRKHLEAIYYSSQDDDDAYRMNLPRMDGNGGWVMTARDYIRFIVRVDGFPVQSDILKPETIAMMSNRSSANQTYALGWAVNSVHNWWHTGSLPGTTSEIARIQSPRYSFAILMNTRSTGPTFSDEIDKFMWNIFNAVQMWPAGINP